MNLIFASIPWYYRLAAIAALALVCVGSGYIAGARHEQRAQEQNQITNLVLVRRIEHQQQAISASSAATAVAHQAAQRDVYRKIIREAKTYENHTSPIGLDAGWVRIHNAAAMATIPGTTSSADAASGAATTSDALDAITENYEVCNTTRNQLIDLQDWITAQIEASKKWTH